MFKERGWLPNEPKGPEETPMAEDAEGLIVEPDPDALAQEAQAAKKDLEQELGAVNPDLPPVLSEEEAAEKLKKDTERETPIWRGGDEGQG